mgnify:FL=1
MLIDNVCFWDVDKEKLDLKRDKFFIIERVLEYGTAQHVKELLDVYSAEEIKTVLEKSRNLSRPTLKLWAAYFNISLEGGKHNSGESTIERVEGPR